MLQVQSENASHRSRGVEEAVLVAGRSQSTRTQVCHKASLDVFIIVFLIGHKSHEERQALSIFFLAASLVELEPAFRLPK